MMRERENQNTQNVIIVQLPKELTPEIDPEPISRMICSFGHAPTPTVRKQVNYSLEYYGVFYVIPNAWANVCQACDEVYFPPSLGEALLEETRTESINETFTLQEERNDKPPEIKGYLE